MALGIEQRSPRRWIRVRAHAGQIDCGCAWIVRFEVLPRVSHVIARNDVKVIAGNARAMTGVTEQDRADGSVRSRHLQHRHVPIHRAVRVLSEINLVAIVNPAVHRERRASDSMFQSRRF